MFGEFLQSMFKEVVGDDPKNQRIAGLPYKFVTAAVGLPKTPVQKKIYDALNHN